MPTVVERLFRAQAVRDICGGLSTHRLLVAHKSSTVLGYTAKWAWDHLIWNGLEYKDHGPHIFAGDHAYLHVPAWNLADGPAPTKLLRSKDWKQWFDRGGVSYRVRPRIEPGDELFGRKVLTVEVERAGKQWWWVITFDAAPDANR